MYIFPFDGHVATQVTAVVTSRSDWPLLLLARPIGRLPIVGGQIGLLPHVHYVWHSQEQMPAGCCYVRSYKYKSHPATFS